MCELCMPKWSKIQIYKMLNKILNLFLAILGALYPIIFWLGYGRGIALWLAITWFLKLLLEIKEKRETWKISLFWVCLFALISFEDSHGVLSMFYPTLVNLALCLLFVSSMRSESIITRFAQLEQSLKKLPPLNRGEINYTRFLNKAWIGVFVWNALFCTFLALADYKGLWALYSGAGGYVLAAVVFFGERILRNRLKERFE